MYIDTNGLSAYRGMGYVNAAGEQVYGPPADPNAPIPDQTSNQIGYLWDEVFGDHPERAPAPLPSSQWVSGIPNWVTGCVGAAFGLVLIKGMR
jgi:hypothetical protein